LDPVHSESGKGKGPSSGWGLPSSLAVELPAKPT